MLRVRVLLVVGAVIALASVAVPQASAQSGGPPPQADFGRSHHAVCGSVASGRAQCLSEVVEHHGRIGTEATAAPSGLAPATLQSVYGFTTNPTAGMGKTIAIVDANDDPSAESDLAGFNSQFGLPDCTTLNGCFTKVDQTGGSSYPGVDPSWALEISLDVQWAHAIAPGAKILLVEANSASFSDLLTAEQYATAHAQYVSNSWGGQESFLDTLFDSYFSAPGVSVFASSGDSGLPAAYPSSSPNVISVGGTTLHFDSSNNFIGETGWSSGGGGCSAYESATSAQSSFSQYGQVNCGGARATPDVAMDADPASGVSVYDSTPYSGQTGWYKVGGTSVSSPVFAARSAVQGAVVDAGYVYGAHIPFRDITSGNNGASCLIGFDLCSGRGSWADTAPPPPPPTVPAAPALTATGGNGVVHLTWNAPANGGSTISNYKVYKGTTSGGETALTTLGNVASFDDTAVSNGTTYYYKVSAVNGVGEGPLSTEASATPVAPPPPPPPTVPAAPALTATGGNGVVHLTWSAPANGGSTISNYKVYRGTTSGGETALTTLGNVASFDDTAVSNGTTYYYKVSAVNGVGEGPLSTEASTTPASSPSVVTHVTSLNGYGQIGLFTWTSYADVNVADQNGHPVSGVTVTFAVTGGTTTTRTCTTNSTGYCSTKKSKVSVSLSQPSVTYTTTNLAKTGTTWDGARWAVTLRLP
jgi:fibronectin type 3 domain-containing protein